MKNNIKAGVLIVLLALPAFVFLFLHQFGKNHFTLPKFIPKMDSVSGQVLMKGKDTIFHQIPSFSFIDQSRKVFSHQQVKGKIYVADFIFTRCGSICPTMTSQLYRVQEAFLHSPDVLLLSHTIDPQYDNPEILKAYAQKNKAKEGKWYFLYGKKLEIYPLALKGYYIPVSDASEYDAIIKNPDEAFIHSEKVMLIDKEGYIRGYYDGTNREDIDRLMAEIKVLQSIYKQ